VAEPGRTHPAPCGCRDLPARARYARSNALLVFSPPLVRSTARWPHLSRAARRQPPLSAVGPAYRSANSAPRSRRRGHLIASSIANSGIDGPRQCAPSSRSVDAPELIGPCHKRAGFKIAESVAIQRRLVRFACERRERQRGNPSMARDAGARAHLMQGCALSGHRRVLRRPLPTDAREGRSPRKTFRRPLWLVRRRDQVLLIARRDHVGDQWFMICSYGFPAQGGRMSSRSAMVPCRPRLRL